MWSPPKLCCSSSSLEPPMDHAQLEVSLHDWSFSCMIWNWKQPLKRLQAHSTTHRPADEVIFMRFHKEMRKPDELGFIETQFLHQETIKESQAATGLLHNRIRHFNELLLVRGSSALLICNEAGHCYRNHSSRQCFWMYLRRWVWIEMQTNCGSAQLFLNCRSLFALLSMLQFYPAWI